jgi:hypothetical protein
MAVLRRLPSFERLLRERPLYLGQVPEFCLERLRGLCLVQ